MINKILDCANEYEVLVAVLTLIGKANLMLAEAIHWRNSAVEQQAFEDEFNNSIQKAREYLKLALESGAKTVENHH